MKQSGFACAPATQLWSPRKRSTARREPIRRCPVSLRGIGRAFFAAGFEGESRAGGKPDLRRAQVEREGVRSLRDFDDEGIVGPLMGVVLGELDPQASGLHTDRGVTLGVKPNGAPQNLGGDLVFLKRYAGVVERMFGQVAEQFAK